MRSVVGDASVLVSFFVDRNPKQRDASILAVAASGRHDALATFDRKLSRRAKDLGATPYW